MSFKNQDLKTLFNNDIIKTLVHEMVHAKYPQDKHGYKFQQEEKKRC
jgi:hypothetical protein